jgi:hypothetical protein
VEDDNEMENERSEDTVLKRYLWLTGRSVKPNFIIIKEINEDQEEKEKKRQSRRRCFRRSRLKLWSVDRRMRKNKIEMNETSH